MNYWLSPFSFGPVHILEPSLVNLQSFFTSIRDLVNVYDCNRLILWGVSGVTSSMTTRALHPPGSLGPLTQDSRLRLDGNLVVLIITSVSSTDGPSFDTRRWSKKVSDTFVLVVQDGNRIRDSSLGSCPPRKKYERWGSGGVNSLYRSHK